MQNETLLLVYKFCDFETAVLFPKINKFFNKHVSLISGENAATILLEKFDNQFVQRREFKLEFKTNLRDEVKDYYKIKNVDREWVIASPCIKLCDCSREYEPSWIEDDEQRCFARIKTSEWRIKSPSIKLMKFATKRHQLCCHKEKIDAFAKWIRTRKLKSSRTFKTNLKRFRTVENERTKKRKMLGKLISLNEIYC